MCQCAIPAASASTGRHRGSSAATCGRSSSIPSALSVAQPGEHLRGACGHRGPVRRKAIRVAHQIQQGAAVHPGEVDHAGVDGVGDHAERALDVPLERVQLRGDLLQIRSTTRAAPTAGERRIVLRVLALRRRADASDVGERGARDNQGEVVAIELLQAPAAPGRRHAADRMPRAYMKRLIVRSLSACSRRLASAASHCPSAPARERCPLAPR